jgi:alpha-amylase/alpha-mannosidase (GH57 family)
MDGDRRRRFGTQSGSQFFPRWQRSAAPDRAEKLYNIHRFENGQTEMHLIFRDHTISDLIGFVYSGMPAEEAARHLMQHH